jgi:hypothetical protein
MGGAFAGGPTIYISFLGFTERPLDISVRRRQDYGIVYQDMILSNVSAGIVFEVGDNICPGRPNLTETPNPPDCTSIAMCTLVRHYHLRLVEPRDIMPLGLFLPGLSRRMCILLLGAMIVAQQHLNLVINIINSNNNSNYKHNDKKII